MIGDAILVAAARRLQHLRAGAARVSILDTSGHVWPALVTRADRATREPGVPVLFLHGFGGDASSWLDLMARLPRDRDLVAVDLPGFGTHHGDSDVPTPSQLASIAAGLLTELTARWGQPPIVAGRSLGGMVAGLAAATAPDMVRALLLISPAGIEAPVVSPFWHAVAAGSNPLIATTEDEWKDMLELVYHAPRRVPGFLRRQLISQARDHRDHLHRAFDALLAEGHNPLGERLSQIACPSYVVWGAHDRVLDPSSLDVVRRELPGAYTELLPECGHSPARERPDRILSLLRRVLVAYG